MKKIYVKPGLKDFSVEGFQMICTSLDKGGSTQEDNVTEADSRRNILWDEDNDFESEDF